MNEYKFEDLNVGQEVEFCSIATKQKNEDTIEISTSMLDAFCELTGDVSPIHIDESYARERGFRDRVCYGMLTAAFYSTLVGVYLPGKNALFQEAHISMSRPVYRGNQLTIKGKIIEMNEALKRITIKARIINETGELVSKATLEVGVAE